MKRFLALAIAFLLITPAYATYVRPYVTKSGKVVNGHYRSSANKTKPDNYSVLKSQMKKAKKTTKKKTVITD